MRGKIRNSETGNWRVWPSVAPNLAESGGAMEGFRWLPTDGGEEGVDVDAGQQDGGK